MSRVTFASGDVIRTCILDVIPGIYERVLPIDTEILDVGVENKEIKLFYFSRSESTRKRKFVVHATDKPLPKNNFQYYFYVGSISRKGLHIFELV